jgi:acyl carrier protein
METNMNTMATQTLDEQIITIIAEETDFTDPITPSLVFYDDIPMDSLTMVEMTMRLEEEFDIDLVEDEESLQSKLSVQQLLDVIHEKLELAGV